MATSDLDKDYGIIYRNSFLTTELHREHKGCAEKILESLVKLQNLFRNARPGDLPFHFARERIALKRISARGTDEFK